MKRKKSIRGVEIHETKARDTVVYIRYQANGKQYRERVGFSKQDKFGKDATILLARKLLKQRRMDIQDARARGVTWVSPKQEKQLAKQRAAATQDARKELLFEAASSRFLDACSESYARPQEVRNIFENRLAKAFAGRFVDEITRKDIRGYTNQRISNTGAFKDCKGSVGLRAPQTELTKLSALYSYLIEEEQRQIQNPCSRPRAGRRKQKKSEVYRPKRKAVIPSRAAIRSLFAAIPTPESKEESSDLTFKALFELFYYTAGRPESEPCQLRHGDVTFPDRDKIRTIDGKTMLGKITFRETKTGDDRTIPLNPEAEADLRAVMEPQPDDPEELETWKQLPIFRKRGKSTPMDRGSYRTAWLATIRAASEKHPELKGMAPRDLRKTARTMMTNARVPEPTIRRIMGHSLDVSQGYHELTERAAEEAILTLSLKNAVHQAVHRDDDYRLSEPA